MNIIGIGTDITKCSRIVQMIEKHADVFLQRIFTANEISYCGDRKAYAQHYTGRFAAKEAVLKALGTGWAKGIHWTDIEVVNEPGGKPVVNLTGQAKRISQSMGISEVMITISHCDEYAVAFATAVGS
jgi:holo-[acyl-carrier protein] synthase